MTEDIDDYLEGAGKTDSMLEAVQQFSTGENVKQKTEIQNPFIRSLCESIVRRMEDVGFDITPRFMNKFFQLLEENYISKDRKSREEMLKAMQFMREKEREEKGLATRLMSPPSSED